MSERAEYCGQRRRPGQDQERFDRRGAQAAAKQRQQAERNHSRHQILRRNQHGISHRTRLHGRGEGPRRQILGRPDPAIP